MEGPEFGELVEDIREHGLLQPTVLHEGRILDGRGRYRACQHAGVEPRFRRHASGVAAAHDETYVAEDASSRALMPIPDNPQAVL